MKTCTKKPKIPFQLVSQFLAYVNFQLFAKKRILEEEMTVRKSVAGVLCLSRPVDTLVSLFSIIHQLWESFLVILRFSKVSRGQLEN